MRMQKQMVEKQKIIAYLYLFYFVKECEATYIKGHRNKKVNKQKRYTV